ncbi:hypothetical protein LWI28_007361 [Acer negundo]|uniref:USP domain-containing protein n=1 Tax=Acer negundo TaxID=4023 RepID=A0AAD5J526_ACENE|nr:hypothetical protein LWI28_007361 [Acer negundo]
MAHLGFQDDAHGRVGQKRKRLVEVQKDCPYLDTGRGQRTQAYTHSLEAEHHVFINLETKKFYCIPEGYEIEDPSLYDIRNVLNPRDFFLTLENYELCKSPIVHRFGELTRKIWHARNYKGHVSPHEFLQAVKTCKKWSQICQHSNPVEFMSWLLNKLHKGLIRTSKENTTTTSSIIHECFQGELKVVKEIINPDNITMETCRMPFLMLGLDLPPPPLSKMMRYRITRLLRYLTFRVGLFVKKDFFTEKNPTLVSFPVKNLVLKDYMLKKYDLIANVVHDGKPEEGIYKVFVQRKSDELWYEMQDLHVGEVLPQVVALSEAYLQIYEQHLLQVPEN